MKTTHFLVGGIVAAGVSAGLLTAVSHAQTPPPLPPLQKNCVYLKEVSTGKIEIRKLVRSGNENTDFAVPTGIRFTSYIAQLLPENNADYEANLYFKYNDGSNAKVFSKKIPAQRFRRYTGVFRSPNLRQPFQINFNISSNRNNAYQIAVMACR